MPDFPVFFPLPDFPVFFPLTDFPDFPDFPLPAAGVLAPVPLGGVPAPPPTDGRVLAPVPPPVTGGPCELDAKHGANVLPSRLREYNAPMIPAALSAAQNELPPLYSASSTGLPALQRMNLAGDPLVIGRLLRRGDRKPR